ncbi:MAG: hypothetical protein WD184_03790 [Acidimicrobiia bacterium]
MAIPTSTAAMLVPTTCRPPWARNTSLFPRMAFDPNQGALVAERIDPKDAPRVFNYNLYALTVTSTGYLMGGPVPTSSGFIGHHSSSPSTWFNDLH